MSAYSDKVIADGAVAYWRLNETSGTTAVDVIGGNNGTISGGVTLNQGGATVDGDKAMAFDGATGKVVALDGAYKQFGTGPCTIECWCKESGTPAFVYPLDAKQDGNSAVAGMGFMLNGANAYLEVNPAGSAALPIGATNVLNGQWHHLVGVIERGATDYGKV